MLTLCLSLPLEFYLVESPELNLLLRLVSSLFINAKRDRVGERGERMGK